MVDREKFPTTQKFSAPHEMDEILELLPSQVTLNVPDHILSLWFPPGASWKGPRSSARKAMRRAADVGSHITAPPVRESSTSSRRFSDPGRIRLAARRSRHPN